MSNRFYDPDELKDLNEEEALEMLFELADTNGQTAQRFAQLLPYITNIHAKNLAGKTLLEVVADRPLSKSTCEPWIQDQVDLLEMLFARGANVNDANDKGFSVFHCIAMYGTTRSIEVILKNGGDPNRKSARGITPFGYVCRHQPLDAILVCLAMGADPAIQDKVGWTPLDQAFSVKKRESYLPLLLAGGNIDLRDNFGGSLREEIMESDDKDLKGIIASMPFPDLQVQTFKTELEMLKKALIRSPSSPQMSPPSSSCTLPPPSPNRKRSVVEISQ